MGKNEIFLMFEYIRILLHTYEFNPLPDDKFYTLPN